MTNPAAHVDRAHATFSPSAAKRWMTCHGSIAASHGVPDIPSAAAAWGTQCHEAAGDILEHGTNFDVATQHLSDEQVEMVLGYTAWIYDLTEGLEKKYGRATTWIETGFKSKYHQHYFGTADYAALAGPVLVVADLKTGFVPVQVRDKHGKLNEQLASYALLTVENLTKAQRAQIERIELWVYQPRVHRDPICIVVDYNELMDFASAVDQSIQAIEAGDETRVAGDHCRYCRARGNCKAQRAFANEMAKADFMTAVDHGIERQTFTDEEMADVLAEVEALEVFINAVREHAQHRMQRGAKIAGWKLVDRRAMARYKEGTAAKVAEIAKDEGLKPEEIYRMTLRTPGQISKALVAAGSWTDIDDFVERRSSGQTIARVNDARDGVTVNPADDFPENE